MIAGALALLVSKTGGWVLGLIVAGCALGLSYLTGHVTGRQRGREIEAQQAVERGRAAGAAPAGGGAPRRRHGRACCVAGRAGGAGGSGHRAAEASAVSGLGARRAASRIAGRLIGFVAALSLIGVTLFVIGCSLFVIGCSLQRSGALPLCPPLPAWSAADQDALAAELDHQDGPVSRRAIHEFEQLRAIDRACLETHP